MTTWKEALHAERRDWEIRSWVGVILMAGSLIVWRLPWQWEAGTLGLVLDMLFVVGALYGFVTAIASRVVMWQVERDLKINGWL